METKSLILLEQFCSQLNAEPAFIFALQEYELVEIIEIEATQYLPEEQLSEVEKMLRLHYDLNINLEGIDAIASLLKQISSLQQELLAVKNKLSLYEAV